MGSIDTFPTQSTSTSNAVLGYAEVLANQTTITTEVDLTGLAVTVSVATGRKIRITGHVKLESSVAADQIALTIKEGSTALEVGQITADTANRGYTVIASAVVNAAVGPHTYKLTAQRSVGSGNVALTAAAGSPAYILVEDITGGTGGSGPIQLAYAETATAQTGITADVDLTGLSVTVSVPSGRRLKITGRVRVQNTGAGNRNNMTIMQDGVSVNQSDLVSGAANTNETIIGEAYVSPSSGTHSYKLQLGATTGTTQTTPSATQTCFISVEDVTGTPSPGGILPTSQTLAYAQITANQTGITTEVDIAGLSVTVSVPDGRRLRISAYLQPFTTVANDTFLTRIYQDGVQIQQSLVGMPITATGYSVDTTVDVTPAAGTHTYKITGFRNNGSGSESVFAAANTPSFILVEDITGGAPATGSANVPVGQLAYAQVTTNQTGITTETLLTGLSVNVVVPAGRVLKVTLYAGGLRTVSDGTGVFRIKEGSTVLERWQYQEPVANQGVFGTAAAIVSPSAGSHTYTATLENTTGTGTVGLDAGGDRPCYIMVEDITPTPAATTGAPSSTLAYSEVQADSGTITTNADLTGLSHTITVPAGRRLRVTFKGEVRGTTGDVWVFAIQEGATVLQRQTGKLVGTASESVEIPVVLAPSAGSHTYKVNLQLASGTGVIFGAAPTYPGFLITEDITASTFTYSQPGVLPVNSTSLPSNPSIGAMVYEVDTGATKIWNGTSWQIFGQGSSTTLGYTEITANQTGIPATTSTDITGATVTVTVPAGRRIKITGNTEHISNAANTTAILRIFEGATQLQDAQEFQGTAGNGFGSIVVWVGTPSAGSHTYKLNVFYSGGTNTISANSTTPTFILVEDITGNVPPAPAISVPVGQLAYAQVTANQGSITTEVDITGLTVNVVVPVGRVIKITGQSVFTDTVDQDEIRMNIKEGATVINMAQLMVSGNTKSGTAVCEAIFSPTAGSHTYKISAQRLSGTGTVTMAASTTFPSFINIEDITPTPASATGAPSSTLGYAEVLTNQAITNTNSDLPGLSVTVTVPAGRRLRISGEAEVQNTQAAVNYAYMRIYEGATQLQESIVPLGVTGANQQFGTLDPVVIISPSAGSHTYKLTAAVQNTAGTVLGSSTTPSYILVEDITGAVWPSGSQVTNGIIASEAWTSFSPVWTSTGTAPVLNNGTLIGRYMKIGRTVHVQMYMQMGSTTTFGTGNYQWSMPFTATGALFVWQVAGVYKSFDSSTGNSLNAIARVYGDALNNKISAVYSATAPAGVEQIVGAVLPWTWAQSDDMSFYYCYESLI